MSRRPKPEQEDLTPPEDGEAAFAVPGEEGADSADVDEELAGPLDLAADGEAVPASIQRGADVIKSYLRDAPTGPGVYRMISAEGEVLYVGNELHGFGRGTCHHRLWLRGGQGEGLCSQGAKLLDVYRGV